LSHFIRRQPPAGIPVVVVVIVVLGFEPFVQVVDSRSEWSRRSLTYGESSKLDVVEEGSNWLRLQKQWSDSMAQEMLDVTQQHCRTAANRPKLY
jgi:hypothetical protein